MIGEAVDTAITLARALAAWIVLLAAVASLALWTVLIAAWGLPAAACRAVGAALAASGAVRALGEQPDRYRPRVAPLWAAA